VGRNVPQDCRVQSHTQGGRERTHQIPKGSKARVLGELPAGVLPAGKVVAGQDRQAQLDPVRVASEIDATVSRSTYVRERATELMRGAIHVPTQPPNKIVLKNKQI
jgi:hypothetical protein